MTQVKIFVQPLDRKVGAFEVGRVRGNARAVESAVRRYAGGGFEVATVPVRVPAAKGGGR